MDDFYNGYSSGSIIEDTMKNFKAGAKWGAEHRGSSEKPNDLVSDYKPAQKTDL